MPTAPPCTPDTYDIVLCQGSDFYEETTLTLEDEETPVGDLTGCTVTAKIRDSFAAGAALLGTFTCTIVSGPGAVIALSMTAAQTAALSRPAGLPDTSRDGMLGYYDAEITDGAKTYRFLQGTVSISSEATR